MSVLIAVASRHGATKDIADVIACELRKEGILVAVREADKVEDLGRFEAVILGSAVYMGRWLPEARHFAGEQADTLRTLPVWLFSSGPIGDPPKPSADSPDLIRLGSDLGARDCRTFAGRLNPDELGLKERIVLKAVGSPTGDFREWDEVRAWSQEIVTALRPVMEQSLSSSTGAGAIPMNSAGI